MTSRDDPNWWWEFRAEDFVFARLAEEQAAAEAMPPGPERDFALNRVESLRLVAADHCIYVDRDGKNYGRCYTCLPSSSGVPCVTMLRLARIWRTHADHKPGWIESIDSAPDRDWVKRTWAAARLGGFKNVYLASKEASA